MQALCAASSGRHTGSHDELVRSERARASVVVVVVVFLVQNAVEVFGEDHATLNIGCGVAEEGQHLLDDLGHGVVAPSLVLL